MANITLEQIKELREKTQVGMMDCKKALIDAEGNMEKAIESYISDDNKIGCLVKLNTETDFSANTDDAKNFTKQLAKHIAIAKPMYIKGEDNNALLNQKLEEKNLTVKECLNELVAKITENIKVGDFARFEIKENGIVNAYIHPGSTLATLVELETDQPVDMNKATGQKIKQLAHDICMQIAVTNPVSIDSSQVPHENLETERKIAREQLIEAGKPEKIIDKILEGKMRKYFEEVCLIEQPFIKDDKTKIKQYIAQVEKDTGIKIQIKQFKRFAVGQ